MTEQTDEAIMKMVQDGDLDKSAILFERYHVKVFNYFLKMTIDKQLSMDLAQNTFYRMLHYRHSFNTVLSFKSWLFGIARNVFFDNTKSKHSKTVSIDILHKEKFPDRDNIFTQFENEALLNALAALNNEDKELIIMSKFENIRYDEICKIMNLSLSSVKVKIHRAIKKLRQLYFSDDLKSNININAN